MRADAHQHVQIARRTAAPPRGPLARQALRRPADRSGRDAHGVAPLAIEQPRPLAGGAADARHLAGPAAPHALAPRGEKTGLLPDDPLAAAVAAGGEPRAGPLGAGAQAGAAVLRPLEGDGLLTAERRLLEVDLQRVAHVAPGGLAPAGQAEQIAEERVEELRRRGDVRAAERARTVDGAEAVVVPPLLLVGEDGVGDRQLLEPLLGRAVTRIAIRMPAQREPSIGRLDLDLGRAAIDVQRLIVVGGQTSPRTVLVETSVRSTPRPAPAAGDAPRCGSPSAAPPRPRPTARRRSRPARPPRARAGRTAVR